LWAFGILAQKNVRIPKIFSLGGFITTTIFALFLYGPWTGISDIATRPAFNMFVTLEWAIYFSIVGYLFIIALYVWRKERNAESQ
ncbi:MAG: hypothetical protein OEV85_15190, partial [Candidatus Thorarchaeota archaeon]|nr:hypothetical protein [Candidatus Thorarchaeota archaeon]